MTFDKTKPKHQEAISNIFTSLYEEGKKRGYSTYRTHVNYKGEFVHSQYLLKLLCI